MASYFSHGNKTLASTVPGSREALALWSGWEQGQPRPTGRQDSVPRAPPASSLPAAPQSMRASRSAKHLPRSVHRGPPVLVLQTGHLRPFASGQICPTSSLGEAPGALNAITPSPPPRNTLRTAGMAVGFTILRFLTPSVLRPHFICCPG